MWVWLIFSCVRINVVYVKAFHSYVCEDFRCLCKRFCLYVYFSLVVFQKLCLVKCWLTLKSSGTNVTFSLYSPELTSFLHQTLIFFSLSPLSHFYFLIGSLSKPTWIDLLFAQTKIFVWYSVTSLKSVFFFSVFFFGLDIQVFLWTHPELRIKPLHSFVVLNSVNIRQLSVTAVPIKCTLQRNT